MIRPIFLSCVRSGLIAAVTTPDALSGPMPSEATVTVSSAVNGGPAQNLDVRIWGPAGVTGFDPRVVARTQPTAGAIEVEPNYFCTVDLSSVSLPWMFTPAAANAGRVRPWIVLVVVAAETCTITEGASDRLPALHIPDVSAELPDLAQSHAWAHAQIADMRDLTSATPLATSLSRLVCARHLDPKKTYIAAIVPAFEPGRLAGLGLPVTASATMQPAWDISTPAALDLPVYHSWTFTTGADGDFEALVSRLKRVSLSADDTTSGRLAVIDTETAGLPSLPPWRFPGALGECPDEPPSGEFSSALTAVIDGAATVAGLPIPPPLYGRWHAGERKLADAAKPWLRRLNLDPRYRAAAGIGTRLIQDHQESLMTAAWSQIGEVEAANTLLRQAQLARHAGSVVHTALKNLTNETLIQLAGPMLSRLKGDNGKTVAAEIDDSRVPAAMVSSAFRRALRPRGPLARRSRTDPGTLLYLVNSGTEPVVTPRRRPDGLVTIDDGGRPGARPWCEVTDEVILSAMNTRDPPMSQDERAMADAVRRLQRDMPGCETPNTDHSYVELERFREIFFAKTDPAKAVRKRVTSRVTGPPGWTPTDPLTPIMATPRIDTPVARDLVALSSELLLPGIARLPVESVTAVPANRRFIEALMIGVNHEMNRELLWRGYPTDQRGTCRHRFWDRSGTVAGPTDDIADIDDTWNDELGDHLVDTSQPVVVIVRGEVLRRYPRTVIYAARAQWVDSKRQPVPVPPGEPATSPTFPERYPAFRGTVDPDLTYIGFELPDDARGDPDPTAARPGWFFVFQQPPTETRFGLDENEPVDVPASGSTDLSWHAVKSTASKHLNFVEPLTGVSIDGWGPNATSADLAAWCEQKPFRICVHASDLLPAESA